MTKSLHPLHGSSATALWPLSPVTRTRKGIISKLCQTHVGLSTPLWGQVTYQGHLWLAYVPGILLFLFTACSSQPRILTVLSQSQGISFLTQSAWVQIAHRATYYNTPDAPYSLAVSLWHII